MFWNPTVKGGRWVVACQTNQFITTMAPLVGVKGIHPDQCQYEPMFVCVDSRSGCPKEPGPWIIRELEKRFHRADDTRFISEMERKQRDAADRKSDPLKNPDMIARGQYTDREIATYSTRGKKHFLVER